MPEAGSSETELTRRYRDGDAEAMCVLFDRHEALLRQRIAYWLPGDVQRRHSVSDVLQEVRIVAMRRCRDFEPGSPDGFRNWVLGIAEKRARSATERHREVAKRSVRREVTRAARVETGQVAGGGPTPSEVAVGNELRRLAAEALAALPEDYRRILRLVREEGRTLQEAADRMSRSYEATKKLYGRALARLGAEFRRRAADTHG